MRTGNPTLNDKTFQATLSLPESDRMTLNGTVNKSGMLLVFLLLGAAWIWLKADWSQPGSWGLWLMGSAITGLILALVISFKRRLAPTLAPVYAVVEGVFIGGISSFAEYQFPGIVLQAVGLTFGTFVGLLMAYRSGLIKVTENFKLGLAAATLGIFFVYMSSFILSFFGINVPYIHESGAIGIGFSCFVVVIAALNLVLDFDFIENGVESGAPKYMEWFAAFGLLVTLIWLYVEILRLLMKLRSR